MILSTKVVNVRFLFTYQNITPSQPLRIMATSIFPQLISFNELFCILLLIIVLKCKNA